MGSFRWERQKQGRALQGSGDMTEPQGHRDDQSFFSPLPSPPAKTSLCSPGWPSTCYMDRLPLDSEFSAPTSTEMKGMSVILGLSSALFSRPQRQCDFALTPSCLTHHDRLHLHTEIKISVVPTSQNFRAKGHLKFQWLEND